MDAADGTERWRFTTEVKEIVWAPQVVGDLLYVGTSGDKLYALSTSDGDEQWRFETTDGIRSPPAVADDTLYVGDNSGIAYALSTADASVKWRTELDADIVASPAVVDGTVYLADREGGIYALSATDGSLQWYVSTEGASPTPASPAVADGTVYVKSGESIHALSVNDGDEQWRVEVGGGWSDPIVVDGAVLVGGTHGLFSLAAEDGRVLGEFEPRSDTIRSPVAVNGSVYVTSQRGRLFALRGGIKPVISGPSHVSFGESVTFSAAKSNSSTASIERYEWVVDGLVTSRDTGLRTSHSFWGPGWSTVKLQVTDSQGRSARASHDVWVQHGWMIWTLSGLAGIGTAGGIDVRRLLNQAGSSATDGSSVEESSTDGEASNVIDEEAFEEFVDAAEAAVTEAEHYRSEGAFDAAVEAYDEAIQQYFAALHQLPDDDDRREDLRTTREDVEAAQVGLEEQRETESELVETLHTAESHFQTAIAAPASDRVVIPRERYRQARDTYEQALHLYDELDDAPETITVSPEVDIAPPPETVSRFPGVTPAATDRLEELEVDTLPALRDADAETIDDLRSAEAIHKKLAVHLVGLHHSLGDEDLTLEGREDIEQRKELAADGYRVHQ